MKTILSGLGNVLVLVLLAGLSVLLIALLSNANSGSATSRPSALAVSNGSPLAIPTAFSVQTSPLATPNMPSVPLARIGAPILLQASGPMGQPIHSSNEFVKAAGEKGAVLFDPSSGLTRTLATTGLMSAHASDHWLVYVDEPVPSTPATYYSRIKIVDVNTGKEILLGDQHANQYDPQISGGYVVWIDWRNREKSGVDIYGYDLTTGKEFPVVADPRPNSGPKISGQWMVYVDPTDKDVNLAELRAHSLKTGEDFVIGIIPAPNDASNGTYYAIDGDKIAWTKYITDGQDELRLYDLTTRIDRKLLDGGVSDLSLSAKNGIIVFPGGKQGWVVLDWFQPTPAPLSIAPPVKPQGGYLLSVAGNYLVWRISLDHDQTDWQIFVAPIIR